MLWILLATVTLGGWPLLQLFGRAVTRRLPDPALPALGRRQTQPAGSFRPLLEWRRRQIRAVVAEHRISLRHLDRVLAKPAPAIDLASRRAKGGR